MDQQYFNGYPAQTNPQQPAALPQPGQEQFFEIREPGPGGSYGMPPFPVMGNQPPYSPSMPQAQSGQQMGYPGMGTSYGGNFPGQFQGGSPFPSGNFPSATSYSGGAMPGQTGSFPGMGSSFPGGTYPGTQIPYGQTMPGFPQAGFPGGGSFPGGSMPFPGGGTNVNPGFPGGNWMTGR